MSYPSVYIFIPRCFIVGESAPGRHCLHMHFFPNVLGIPDVTVSCPWYDDVNM